MTTSKSTHLLGLNSLTRLSSEELDLVVGGLPEGYYVTYYDVPANDPRLPATRHYNLFGPSGFVGKFTEWSAMEAAAQQDLLSHQG